MKVTVAPTTFEERVDLLFQEGKGDFDEIRSSLILLKAEAYKNFRNDCHWAGAMCTMAGIDLVAKFYCNSDDHPSGNRFKRYLEEMMKLSKRDAELVYQARNAFMHSFGLYSVDRKANKYFIHPRYGDKWPFVIRETWDDGEARHFELGISTLFESFQKSLRPLKEYLLENKPDRFEDLFDKYGTDKPLFEKGNFYDYCNILGVSTRFE